MTPDHWKEIERLYLASQRLPPDKRANFLATSCRNEEMRRKVEALLAERENAPSFLEGRGLDMAAEIISSDQGRTLVGRTLGHYEILALVGAGGMGQVYRARDRKLDRDVALKTLPAEFSEDPERMRRSEREAKLLASLNHPNIAAIYHLQESDDVRCLILEFVEGETLAKTLKRGPLPMAEALEISRQIADALEAAHEQGIVHRDLKPGNVMRSADSNVKVLDFGIAKMLAPQTGASVQASIDSASEGIVLGTLSYMSPEQARGRPIDKRTDIWSFGCVLYELLTGRHAFHGETTADTLTAILEREPDWLALPKNVPDKVRDLLRRCLQKDVRQRLRDIGDARIQIGEAAQEALSPILKRVDSVAASESAGHPGSVAVAKSSNRWVMPILASLVIALALVSFYVSRQPKAPVRYFQIGIQPADYLDRISQGFNLRPWITSMALSQDGTLLVFSAARGTASQLYARRLDQPEATPIPGTEEGVAPFFSPDGQWIGFWEGNNFKKVPLSGGPATVIAEAHATTPRATWANDGTIFFGSNASIFRISSGGGTPTAVITFDQAKGERYILPEVLPSGRALIFTTLLNTAESRIEVQRLDTGERHTLLSGAADARYVPTGHLVYMKTGTLMAVPFDLERLQITGAPVALIENVMQAVNAPNTNRETLQGQFAVSNSGTLLYLPGGIYSNPQFLPMWVHRDGQTKPLAAAPTQSWIGVRLSPDGSHFAAAVRGSKPFSADIWVCDIVRATSTRLTFEGNETWPVWSADGEWVAYASNKSGVRNIFMAKADASGKVERLTTSPYPQSPSSWSARGNLLAFLEFHDGKTQIWVLPVDGDRKPRLFLESSFTLSYPEFSPDAHWITYTSTESGREEVYVQAYPGPGPKTLLSTAGASGAEPLWTANGREIIFVNWPKFFSVRISSVNPLRVETPRLLFESREHFRATPIRGWDSSPDGQRFLLLHVQESAPPKPVTQIYAILNWTEELKRRVRSNTKD